MKHFSLFLCLFFMLFSISSKAQKTSIVGIKNAEQVASIVDKIIAMDNYRIPSNNIFSPEIYKKVSDDSDIQIPIIVYLADNRIVTYMVEYISKTKIVNIWEDEFAQIPADQSVIQSGIANASSKYRQGFTTTSLDLLKLINKKRLKKEYETVTKAFEDGIKNDSIQGRYSKLYNLQLARQTALTDSLALNTEAYKKLDMGDELCFMYQSFGYNFASKNAPVKVMSGFIENLNADKTRFQIRISFVNESLNYTNNFMAFYPKKPQKGDIIWIKPLDDYKTTWDINEKYYGGTIKYLTLCKK